MEKVVSRAPLPSHSPWAALCREATQARRHTYIGLGVVVGPASASGALPRRGL